MLLSCALKQRLSSSLKHTAFPCALTEQQQRTARQDAFVVLEDSAGLFLSEAPRLF